MTAKYHVNPKTGEVNICRASKKPCQFGEAAHHETAEAATEYFAKSQETVNSLSKKKSINFEISPELQETVDCLTEVSRPLMVGGAVRDSILGVENKDFDIEAHGTDIDTLTKHLRNNGYRVDEVGKQFGVLKASKGKMTDLDISVPRQENRTGAGHRAFEVSLKPLTVEEAAERRDFTFNAIMYDPNSGEMIDPTGGQKDLKNRTLKHVPEKFKEDPLRVLRGFQFASRFNLQYDPETAKVTRSMREEYSDLSIERVREEWSKFYTKGRNPRSGVKALQDSGWDDTIPGLRNSLANEETVKELDNLPKAKSGLKESIGSAIIAHRIPKNKQDVFLDSTTTSKKMASQARTFNEARGLDLSTPKSRKWYAKNSKTTFQDLEVFARVTDNAKLTQHCQAAKKDGVYTSPEKDLIDGNQIMTATGKKPGPWMKTVVEKVREEQYSGRIKNQTEALAFAVKSISDK